MTKAMLYRYEVKGIQKFIMSTDKLKELKGGSGLIVGLADLFLEAREKAGLVGEGVKDVEPPVAGGATMRVDMSLKDKLEDFMAGWPMLVHFHAPGLQVVQACVQETQDKKQDMKLLYEKLWTARSRRMAILPEAGPFVMRAPRTGLPASELDKDPTDNGEEKVAVDPSSLRKRQVSDNDFLGNKIGKDYRWVENFEDFRHSYIGVVHADTNDLGARKMQLSEDELKNFAERVADATLSSVRHAVENVLEKNKREDGKLPARPIVVGGDDITFIVRADLAFEFALTYLKEFKELTKQTNDNLEATAGVALVHKSHPFYMAHDLAEGLCSFAKKVLRGLGKDGVTPSSIAFFRLTTSLSEEYDDMRDEWLSKPYGEDGKGKSTRYLTMCPYTLDQVPGFVTVDKLRELVDLISADREKDALPAGVLRDLVSMQQSDPKRATRRWQRFGQVAKESYPVAWSRLKNWFESAGGDPAHDCWIKFGNEKKWIGSPWLDVLTLAHVDVDQA